MSVDALQHATIERSGSRIIHPVWVRVTHWINAIAMIMMILSGWQIYNASPLFPFDFPIGLGGWLAGALLWHFAAMWLLVVNGLVYLTLGIATGRFQHKLLPIRLSEVVRDFLAALRGTLSHADLSVYNAVQRLLYLGVILAGIVAVRVRPVDLEACSSAGTHRSVRRLRHGPVRALLRHGDDRLVSGDPRGLALIVPKSLRAMVIGR